MGKQIALNGIAVVLLAVVGMAFYPVMSAHGACPADMVAYWKLNETTGPNYNDLFGQNNGEGNPDPTAAAGIVGGAQYFDGSGQSIEVPASRTFGWLGSEDFSIELWVKPDGAPGTTNPADNQVFIGRQEPGTGLQWWLGLGHTSGKARLRIEDGTGGLINLTDPGDGLHLDGQWHHLVAVRDGFTGDTSLYVDGAFKTTGSSAFERGFGSDTPLYFGRLDGVFPFKGWLDEVFLYDRVLSEDEILNHYAAGREMKSVASLRPAPVADAGPNQTGVKATSEVTLNGIGSPGYPEAPITQYFWEQTGAGPSVTLDDATSANPKFNAPGNVDAAGVTLTFQLTVTAQDGQQDADTVDVGVVAIVAPVAVAATDKTTVNSGETVELDGSGSSDPDGNIVSYEWRQTAGSISVTLSDAAAIKPTFQAPEVDAAEDYTFELTVTDDDGLEGTDTVTITVNPADTALPAPSGGGGGGGCFINSTF